MPQVARVSRDGGGWLWLWRGIWCCVDRAWVAPPTRPPLPAASTGQLPDGRCGLGSCGAPPRRCRARRSGCGREGPPRSAPGCWRPSAARRLQPASWAPPSLSRACGESPAPSRATASPSLSRVLRGSASVLHLPSSRWLSGQFELSLRRAPSLRQRLCGGSELALSWQLVGMVSYRRATYAMFSAPVPWPAGGGARSPGAAGAARRQVAARLIVRTSHRGGGYQLAGDDGCALIVS